MVPQDNCVKTIPMSDSNKKMPRRKLLPLLAGALVLPYMGMGKDADPSPLPGPAEEEGEFMTLLKPDGTVVKVPRKTVEQARIVQKNISNGALLGWLKTPNK